MLDLDDFLFPGDYISEDLQLYIGECVSPQYSSPDFLQGGDPIKIEDDVEYYMTVSNLGDGIFLYLGILPEFKQ